MPKRIPDLKNQLLKEAEQLLLSEGYAALSMRALAERCHIATGTVYNYFASKDELIACIMLQDWQCCLRDMAQSAATAASVPDGFAALCQRLAVFSGKYRRVWAQYGGSAGGYMEKYHGKLRAQLAGALEAVLTRCGRTELAALSGVLAETMLACALNDDLGAEKFGLLASKLTPSEHT